MTLAFLADLLIAFGMGFGLGWCLSTINNLSGQMKELRRRLDRTP